MILRSYGSSLCYYIYFIPTIFVTLPKIKVFPAYRKHAYPNTGKLIVITVAVYVSTIRCVGAREGCKKRRFAALQIGF